MISLFHSKSEKIFTQIHSTLIDIGSYLQNSGKWKPDGKKGECGTQINFSNIVGGSITKTGDFPYMALLGSKAKNRNAIQYTCGGSLINKWYVLTAAHCLYNEDGEIAKPE